MKPSRVPQGFSERPPRFFVPVVFELLAPLGLRGFIGGPSGYEEVEAVEECPILVRRERE